MSFLVVIEPFGRFDRGSTITDPKEVATALASHEEKVVRVTTPAGDEPSGETE